MSHPNPNFDMLDMIENINEKERKKFQELHGVTYERWQELEQEEVERREDYYDNSQDPLADKFR